MREKTIYCSNPKNFNDPWDCKPWFDLSLLDDVNEYSKVKDFITKQIRLAPQINPELLEEVIENSVGDRHCIENTLTSLFSRVADSHAKSFRIYCLTPYCENALMWAHYADRHTGICIEYDSTDQVFGGAWQVRYNNEFPELKFYEEAEDPMFQLLHKSDVWRYENEYRLISREPIGNPEFDDSPLGSVEGVFKLPENSLRSIIVGCAAPYQEIADLLRELSPSTKVKRAVRASHKYTLEIEHC